MPRVDKASSFVRRLKELADWYNKNSDTQVYVETRVYADKSVLDKKTKGGKKSVIGIMCEHDDSSMIVVAYKEEVTLGEDCKDKNRRGRRNEKYDLARYHYYKVEYDKRDGNYYFYQVRNVSPRHIEREWERLPGADGNEINFEEMINRYAPTPGFISSFFLETSAPRRNVAKHDVNSSPTSSLISVTSDEGATSSTIDISTDEKTNKHRGRHRK